MKLMKNYVSMHLNARLKIYIQVMIYEERWIGKVGIKGREGTYKNREKKENSILKC